MQNHKNIKALFFLGVFSMLLLHQVLPHMHHQHKTEHQKSNVVHTHQHGHQHDIPENDNSKKGLLDWFLAMHIHTSTSVDVMVFEQCTVKKATVKKELVKSFIVSETKQVIVENSASNKIWYNPPNRNQSPYFPNHSQRGPPNLG